MSVFDNHALMVSAVAWALAQSLKVLILLVQKKRLELSKLVSSGGMPSSHSALVTSLAAAIGMRDGVTSSSFALAMVFAAVVMYDAAGIRHAVSIQARLLNKLIDEYVSRGEWNERRLRELLGHTRIEVVAGFLLGLAVAFTWR